MTNPTSRSDTPSGGAAGPVVFDPATSDPGAAGAPVPGAILLLVADPDRRWAAETAVELASAWARGGRRVVLADLHLESPILHEVTGTPNLEGVTDVFLYGASLSRSAHPVRGRGIYLISAGTYEPDSETIFRHPRWGKLVAGFRDADATLVLFAPADGAEVRTLAPHLARTLLLGDLDDALAARLVGSGMHLDGVLVSPSASGLAAERAAPAAVLPPPVVENRELSLPPPPVRPARRSRRGLYLAIASVVLLLLLAGAGYWVYRNRPELLRGLTGSAPRPDTTSAAAAAPPPEPVRAAQPLPFSVQVIAFQGMEPASEHLGRQSERFGEVPFLISPESIQGVLYFKILAGALPDTVAAHALREQLVAAGAVDEEDAAGSWDLIQSVPLAYDLGEYPSTEAARAAADSLAAREVPAYAVPIPYTDGTQRWQLYAGAYRDSAAAQEMRTRLVAAGVPARLVQRVGAVASAAEQEGG